MVSVLLTNIYNYIIVLQPYFLAYWIHSWYAVCYVVWKGWREFPGNCQCNSSGDGALHWK